MKFTKKIIPLLSCFILASSMIAGCSKTAVAPEVPSESSKDTQTGQTETAKNDWIDEGTNIEVWTFLEFFVPFYTEMADNWNEQHQDNPININVTMGDTSAMHTKLLIALQSGTGAPDISDVEVGYYSTFLNGGYFAPINDVVDDYENDVVMSRISMYGDKEGNYYGVDFHLGASAMYYNMDYMNQSGVNPEDIVTWDDYIAAGEQVKKATGKPMTVLEVSDLFLPQTMTLELGGQFVKKDGSPNIDSPEHLQALEKIREMQDKGIVELCPGKSVHSEEFFGYMNEGKAASLDMPLWYMKQFVNYMPDLKEKIAIYPVPVWNEGDTRCVLQGGTGTSVIAASPNVDLAKEFLAYAKLSEEGNTFEWEIVGMDPIRTTLWFDEKITENPDNKFLHYFIDGKGPFDLLQNIYNSADVNTLVAPDISGTYADTTRVLTSTTYYNLFEGDPESDIASVLKEEQASVITND